MGNDMIYKALNSISNNIRFKSENTDRFIIIYALDNYNYIIDLVIINKYSSAFILYLSL
jgi:hypothetical protein